MKKLIISAILGFSSLTAAYAGPDILDLKHSIDDSNINAAGITGYEAKAQELEENWYLQSNTVDGGSKGSARLGTPDEYKQKLLNINTSIEMPYNEVVRKWIDMYLGKRSRLVSDMLALQNYYGDMFVEELEKEGVPVELQYLPVIESAINPNAVSPAGATGLWQFMPGTAKGLGMEVSSLVDMRRAPRESSKAAAKYLRQLYDIYGDWSLAIAAYNCGPGNVNKAIRRAGGGKKDFWEIYNYLPNETRGYVPAFIAATYVMTYHNDHNIAPRVVKKPLVTDTVSVNKRVHFNQISKVLNIPVEEIKMLNPQFRQNIIPGNNKPYMLTLPQNQIYAYVASEDEILNCDKDQYARRSVVEPGKPRNHNSNVTEDANANASNATGDVAQNNVDNNNNNAATQQPTQPANNEIAQADLSKPIRIVHTVGHGENLRDIARKYNVSATDIKRWNNMRRAKVKEGDELVIETYDRENYQAQARNDVAVHTPTSAPAANNTSDVPLPPAKKPQTTQPSVPARQTSTPASKPANNYVPPRQQQPKQPTNTYVPPRQQQNNKGYGSRNYNSGSTSSYYNRNNNRYNNRYNTAASGRNQGQQGYNNNNRYGKQQTAQTKNNKQTAANTKQTTKSNAKQPAKQQPKQPVTRNETVKKGDSYYTVAKRTGVSVEELKKANNAKSDNLQPGQTLKVPTKANNNKQASTNNKNTKQNSKTSTPNNKQTANNKNVKQQSKQQTNNKQAASNKNTKQQPAKQQPKQQAKQQAKPAAKQQPAKQANNKQAANNKNTKQQPAKQQPKQQAKQQAKPAAKQQPAKNTKKK